MIIPQLNLKHVCIVTDREDSIINALKHCLPDAHVLLCWNHIFQDIKFWLKNNRGTLDDKRGYDMNIRTLMNCESLQLFEKKKYEELSQKWIDLINRTFIRENTQYLACNEECAFFTSDVYNNHNLWSCKKSVMPLFIFWIIFLLDLELNFIDNLDKLLVFRWELIVLLLLQIYFFFVMREIS